MDEELENEVPEQSPEPYKPRPLWQVRVARVALVIVIIAVILYYLQIARGGR